jgi:hypothetical protein
MKRRMKYSMQLMMAASALCLASGVAFAEGPVVDPNTIDHSKMDHGSMDRGAMNSSKMDSGKMDHGAMGGMMGGGGMAGMDHGGKGGMDHGGSGGGMMKQMMCGFTEHLDARLAYLKAELKLTDSQAAQWNAFNDAFRTVAQKASQRCEAMDAAAAQAHRSGVLGALDKMEHHMTEHLEQVRGQRAALEPLYAALSDEQKKVADETLSGMMKVGMSMMSGGGTGGMEHGGGGMMGGGMGGMKH